jgi:hypothetical protein
MAAFDPRNRAVREPGPACDIDLAQTSPDPGGAERQAEPLVIHDRRVTSSGCRAITRRPSPGIAAALTDRGLCGARLGAALPWHGLFPRARERYAADAHTEHMFDNIRDRNRPSASPVDNSGSDVDNGAPGVDDRRKRVDHDPRTVDGRASNVDARNPAIPQDVAAMRPNQPQYLVFWY